MAFCFFCFYVALFLYVYNSEMRVQEAALYVKSLALFIYLFIYHPQEHCSATQSGLIIATG